MGIDSKLPDAIEELVADETQAKLQWPNVQARIIRSIRRRVIGTSVVTVAAIVAAFAVVPRLPLMSERGVTVIPASPTAGEEASPTPSPSDAPSAVASAPVVPSSKPSVHGAPSPVQEFSMPPAPPDKPVPDGALEHGSRNGLQWWLTADEGEAFQYPDQRPLATPTVYCDEPKECIRLTAEGGAVTSSMTSYEVPAGTKKMEWQTSGTYPDDGKEGNWYKHDLQLVMGAVVPEVKSVRIELRNRPAVTLAAKPIPGFDVRYFFADLYIADEITSVIAFDASGNELQRDPWS